MDIQKEREAFELALVNQTSKPIYNLHLCTVFNAEENEYYPSDVCDSEEFHIVGWINISWQMWRAAKSQAIPEDFVLVPKSEMSDWYLDESDSMYLEEMDHWACEIEVGEVVTVERKKVWDIPDQYVAKAYVDEDNIDWQLFDDEAEAQKAAAHCKAMIEATEEK